MRLLDFAIRQRLRDWPCSLAFIAVIGSALAVAGAWLAIAEPLWPSRIPFRDPQRLVAIGSLKNGQTVGVKSNHLESLRTAAIESIAGFLPRTWGLQTEPRGHVEVVLSQQVTAEFFEVLGVSPMLGAPLTRLSDPHSVWFAHDAWTRLLGGVPAAVGKLVWINAVPYRVAGVLPRTFDFPHRGQSAEIYILLNPQESSQVEVIARLRPGAGQFAAALDGTTFAAADLSTTLLGDRLHLLNWLLAAVVTLVLVAMANASGIWLAQWLKQQRQASIQLVLGAPLRRVLTEQLTQAVILGVVAAVVAMGGAFVLLALLHASPWLGAELGRLELWSRASLNPTTALWLLAAAMSASLLSAVLPLLTIRAHASGTRTATTRFSNRTRLGLAVAQLTLTGALAYTGVLIWRNVQSLFDADRGFRTEQVLISGIGIPESKYNTDERMIEFHQRTIAGLARIPGVMHAAGGISLPVATARTRFLLEGENVPREEQRSARFGAASPGLLPLLGVPLVRGRGFAESDRWGTQRVALVNQAFADRYLREPVGRRVRVSFYNGFGMKPYEEHVIVGVIGNTLNRDLAFETEPQIVISTNQIALEGFFYFLRSTLPASSLQRAVRQAVWDVDPEIQSVSLKPLSERVEQSLVARRTMAWLAGLFGWIAASIVACGLASSLSATFLEMTRELGIRAALGASPVRLAHAAVRWGLLAVGLSWLLVYPITVAVSKLAGLGDWDLSSWLLSGLALALIGVASAYLPARRAAMVNPALTLRDE
jgi:putative ABC transport system permease protein